MKKMLGLSVLVAVAPFAQKRIFLCILLGNFADPLRQAEKNRAIRATPPDIQRPVLS